MTTDIQFARTKGAKDKEPRARRGSRFGQAKQSISNEIALRRRRAALKDEILDDKVSKIRAAKKEADALKKASVDAKNKKRNNLIKNGLGLGITGAGGLLALKNPQAVKKIIENTGAATGKGIVKAGGAALGGLKKTGLGAKTFERAMAKEIQESVSKATSETIDAVKKKGKEELSKATVAVKEQAKETVKKVPGSQRTYNNGAQMAKGFYDEMAIPSVVDKQSKLNKAARFLARARAKYEPGSAERFNKSQTKKSRKKAEKTKPSERTGRVGGSLFSRRVYTIDFAKKKAVRVKGYVRSDGVKVRPSTRDILYTPPTTGERVASVALAAKPIAEALSIAAGAYATILGAQDSRSKTTRDLSAIGETRKFLGLSGQVGTGLSSSVRGINNLRGFKSELKLKQKGMAIKKMRALSNNRRDIAEMGSLAEKMGIQRDTLDIRREMLNQKNYNSTSYRSFTDSYAESVKDKKTLAKALEANRRRKRGS